MFWRWMIVNAYSRLFCFVNFSNDLKLLSKHSNEQLLLHQLGQDCWFVSPLHFVPGLKQYKTTCQILYQRNVVQYNCKGLGNSGKYANQKLCKKLSKKEDLFKFRYNKLTVTRNWSCHWHRCLLLTAFIVSDWIDVELTIRTWKQGVDIISA